MRQGTEAGNARNGPGRKTVPTAPGPGDLAVPRARYGRVGPRLLPKRPRRLEGVARQGRSLYARGLSPRESQGHGEARSGTEMSPPLLATRTEAVLDEGRPWPARPLASVSPLLAFDAWVGQAREEGAGQTQAVSRALGGPMAGEKALLGLGRRESAGAPCGRSVFPERHNRDGQAWGIAWGEGLQGLPEAMAAGLPKPPGQWCSGQKVRHRLKEGPWQERRGGAAALRAISGAAPLPDAAHALARCAERWDTQEPASSPRWRAAWERLTVLLEAPPAIRRALSTTNAIESWHSSLRKVRKGRGAFPNDEAIVTLLYRGLPQGAQKWTQPMPAWKAARNQFVILLGERVQI